MRLTLAGVIVVIGVVAAVFILVKLNLQLPKVEKPPERPPDPPQFRNWNPKS